MRNHSFHCPNCGVRTASLPSKYFHLEIRPRACPLCKKFVQMERKLN